MLVNRSYAPKRTIFTYPVFSFSHLEDFKLLPTRALRHLPLDLVINTLSVGQRAALLPIGSQRRHKLAPIDHAVAVVEFVRDGVQLKLA